ncbi:MAG: cytochrome c biogenesis protein ResB, partial [Phycisphaerae bacterium]
NHARLKQTVEPVTPVRKERTPAILLTLKTSDHTNEMWVLKDRSYPVSIEGVPHEVAFTDKTIPLGFSVTLDRFRVGYYPGTGRPRSFQSNMTITDPAGGRELSRVVSMNNPTSYGGYTFYQSSYDQRGAKALSILSVSRDPGQPIVFAGYFLLIAGMLWVLVLRMRERSRTQRTENAAARPPVVRPRLDDTVREPTPEPAPAPAGSNGEHLRSTEPTERDPETDYTFQR